MELYGSPSEWSSSLVYALGPVVAGLDHAELLTITNPQGISHEAILQMDTKTLQSLPQSMVKYLPQEALSRRTYEVTTEEEEKSARRLLARLERFYHAELIENRLDKHDMKRNLVAESKAATVFPGGYWLYSLIALSVIVSLSQ
jgi:alcohol dehydrogenase YqhD (iron-dependent ADH family)